MTRKRPVLFPAAFAAALLFFARAAPAADFGVRGGVYSDAEAAFVGGEALVRINPVWYFNPNFEYAFVDRGDLYTLNADVHYDLDVPGSNYVWLGGGPALIVSDPDRPRAERDTDVGLNVLAGIGWRGAGVVPYVQGKIVLADDTEAVLAFGVRF